MYRFVAAGLAPWLLWQGRRVRRETPKLPEPPGAREGTTGAGPPLRLLIAGDSAAAGVGTTSQEEALLGQLVGRLARSRSVRWQLIAQIGDKTPDTLRKLSALPDLRADLAVISLGVNDVTSGTRTRSFVRNYESLVRWLIEKAGAQRLVVSSLPPVGRFPALPHPLRWVLGQRALEFGRALQEIARRHPACVFVPIDDLTDVGAMASDGFHPGPAAYADWADRITRALASQALAGSEIPLSGKCGNWIA